MYLICANARRKVLCAAAAVFLLAIAGCATPPSGGSVPTQSPPTVFGRVVATRDGDTQRIGTIGNGFFDLVSQRTICYALVFSESENRGLKLPFDIEGWFAWKLDHGEYAFSAIWCVLQVDNSHYTLPVGTRFRVGSQADRNYIGHFRLKSVKGRFDPIAWKMDEPEAAAEFARRYPGAGAAIPQDPVPDRGPGNFRAMALICGSEWGLECGRRWQGVEAVEPAVVHRGYGPGFAPVDTLVPTLKWKPATAAGVTYDVAVWEAVTYDLAAYSLGRLVVYWENIDAPQFAIPDPLKPATKYFWSVRLRKGDRVSTWSLGGQLTILLFVNSSSSGELFSFETP